jgi:hypothetical protein
MTSKVKSSMLATQTFIKSGGTGATLQGDWYIGTTGGGAPLAGTLNGPLNGLASQASKLSPGATINGVGFDGSAAISVPVNTTNTALSADYFVTFVSSNTPGNQSLYTNGNFKINPNSGTLTLSGAIYASNLPATSTIGANVSIAASASLSGSSSGTNTGDQTLSGLGGAALSGATFTGRIVSRQSGVTLGTSNSSQLEINNAASGAANISFQREGIYGAHFGLDTDNWFSTYGWSAGTGYTSMRVGSLSATGDLTATGDITGFSTSDQKFKENIKPIENAVDTVVALGGKLFDWSDDYIALRGGEDHFFVQKSDFGVIAQDVQKVFPLAVRTREDGSLAVDYAKLSALAFAAIAELKKQIDILNRK